VPKGIEEVRWKRDIEIVEAGNVRYTLHLKLVKSRLIIQDGEGNRIAVDKRKGRIAIERRGNVDWHREKR